MDRPKLEVADVFRRYGEAYRNKHGASMSTGQRRVMTAIEVCRTAALGGHLERCDQCGHERNASIAAGTATAQNVSLWLGPNGLRTAKPNFLRSLIFMSSSPCRKRLPRSPPEQGGGLWHSLPGHSRDSENHRSGSQTPRRGDRLLRRPAQLGVKTSSFIRTCIASFPAADCRPTAIAGFPAGRTSFCRSGFCLVCFAGSSWNPWRGHSMPANFSSSAPWSRSGSRCVRPASGQAEKLRMGCLCQSSVRRTPASARLRGPLYPSRRHLQ